MKIKRILLSVLALALVAALSVGATLAFLSAEDTKVTNNFSFGGIDVQIVENEPTNLPAGVTLETVTNDDGIKAITYKNVIPGAELSKTPVISVDTSVKAYVFINVSGFDANLTCTRKQDNGDGTTTLLKGEAVIRSYGWTPATRMNGDNEVSLVDGNGNGIYYREVDANTEMTKVASAFEYVTVSSTCDGSETLPTVYIDVFAIQFDNISFAEACAAAAASFAAEAAPAPTPAPET